VYVYGIVLSAVFPENACPHRKSFCDSSLRGCEGNYNAFRASGNPRRHLSYWNYREWPIATTRHPKQDLIRRRLDGDHQGRRVARRLRQVEMLVRHPKCRDGSDLTGGLAEGKPRKKSGIVGDHDICPNAPELQSKALYQHGFTFLP